MPTYAYIYIYIYIYKYKENGSNGKQQLPFYLCLQNAETANFRLFAANGNGSLFSLVSKQ
jgi:hypothetical protein